MLSPLDWMSQLALWNPEDVGSNANEGVYLPDKNRAFFLPCPLYRLPTEGVVPMKGARSTTKNLSKGVSSHLHRPGLKVGLLKFK